MRIQWEAWCYRCRGRDAGVEDDERTARERVMDFRHDHQGSCGTSASFGSIIEQARTVSLTGDGFPRAEEA